jgi:peptidoglycan/xylan/chitin deacetylase (PgdA/CDA1 family)
MNWRRVAVRTVSEVSALSRTRMKPGFRVLLYHAVGSRPAHDSYGFSIKPEQFERQMEALAKNKQLEIRSFPKPQPSHSPLRVAVTFDDGFKDNLRTAAPILLKFNIPFTVFVTASFIKSEAQEYLTPSELRELASLPGVTIGSHGMTHLPLAQCDDSTLRQELSGSRSYIENVIGTPVTAIAYPHGSVDARVRDAASDAGYITGGCSLFGINDEGSDPLLLRRCEVVARDTERAFHQKLSGAWDWYSWHQKRTRPYEASRSSLRLQIL